MVYLNRFKLKIFLIVVFILCFSSFIFAQDSELETDIVAEEDEIKENIIFRYRIIYGENKKPQIIDNKNFIYDLKKPVSDSKEEDVPVEEEPETPDEEESDEDVPDEEDDEDEVPDEEDEKEDNRRIYESYPSYKYLFLSNVENESSNFQDTYNFSSNLPNQTTSSTGYLWIVTDHWDTSSNQVFKVDSSGNLVSYFVVDFGYQPQGIAHDGTNLWITDSGFISDPKIRKYSTNGNELTSINPPSNLPGSIVYSGGYLYVAAYGDGLIYKMTTSGDIVSSFNSPSNYPYGLTFDGTYFWILDVGTQKIYKVTSSGTQITNFDVPENDSVGLAYDGQYLWVSNFYGNNIYKITTSGSVVATIPTPQRYTKGIGWESAAITCSFDSDCGSSYWKNTPYCSNNDVYDYWMTPTCANPGTTSSYCYDQQSSQKKQDCGTSSCGSWGSNYCKNNDVYHSRTCNDRGCLANSCYSTPYTNEQLAEDCQYGCENGECSGHCTDGIKNEDETGIDCGGSCPNQDCCTNNYKDENLGEEGVDCGGSCHYSCVIPVVLVHGYQVLNPIIETWEEINASLVNDGYDVHVLDLENLLPARGDIKIYAKKLEEFIDEVQHKTKARKIDIVSHCMGGLVARSYISMLFYSSNSIDSIRNLIMIGTPNHGSEQFYKIYIVYLVEKYLTGDTSITDFILGEAAKQMIPNSDFLKELNGGPSGTTRSDFLPSGIGYFNIIGNKSNVSKIFGTDRTFIDPILPGEHDGFSTVKSARLDNVNFSKYYYGHFELPHENTVYNKINYLLETGIVPLQSLSVSEVEESQDSIIFQELPQITGTIEQGQQKTYQVSLDDADEVQFTFSYLPSNLTRLSNITVELGMPNGTIIDSSVDDSEIHYFEGILIKGYLIENPQIGEWTIYVNGYDVVEDSINFTIFTFVKTNITLSIPLNKYVYKANEQINITAELKEGSNAVTGTTITANIEKPDSTETLIYLYDDGTNNDATADDGVYNNIYTSTNLYGEYDITVTATGTNPNFERTKFTTVWVKGYPDLTVNNITLSKTSYYEGEDVIINAEIENLADFDANNATIEFYLEDLFGGLLLYNKTIDVNSYDKVNLSFNWTNVSAGTHNISVQVSPFNEFIELNYSNNKMNKEVYVSILFGRLESYLIYPLTDLNVTQNKLFNFSSGVRCVGGECGDINVSLDPTDPTPKTCSGTWGFECGTGPPETGGDNTFDDCPNGNGNDESVEEIFLNVTEISFFEPIKVTCMFDPFPSDDYYYIWYYNGTGWKNLLFEGPAGSSFFVNKTAEFIPDNVLGVHWIRCSISYVIVDNDGCVNGNGYYDNDDLNFTVSQNVKGTIPMNNGDPFYTIDQNPALCNNMKDGDSCNQSWTVNATGNIGFSYDFFTIYESINYSTFIPKNETNKIKITIKENQTPVLHQIQCQENNTLWQDCSNINYNDNLTKVRVNCTDIDGEVINANFKLINIPDNNIFFYKNGTKIDNWFVYDNNDINTQDSGEWNLTVSCTDNEGLENSHVENWIIPFGILQPYLIYPLTDLNVSQNKFFNFSSGVRCIGGECGGVNATLDPEPFRKIIDRKQIRKDSKKIDISITKKLEKESLVDVIVMLKDEETIQRSPMSILQKNKLSEIKSKIKKKQEITLSKLDTQSEFRLKYKYDTINGFAGKITKKGLDKLNQDPNVEAVYEDKILHISLAESVPLINATNLWDLGITGEDSVVCVADTGIDYNHPDLGGCFGTGCKVLDGYDFVNNDADPMDDNNHGTHVAGIVAANGVLKGVAPDAKLLALKVCNSAGDCFGSAMIAAVDWCNDHSDVYNIVATTMSIGDEGEYNTATCPTWMDTSINTANDLGISVTVASGNEYHSNGISYPACSPNAISVGSTTKSDIISDFTNTGELLDILAPGSDIYSTLIDNNGYESGTSMAAPHAAGAIALLKQYSPSALPDQIKAALKTSDVVITDPDNGLSFPRIDALAAMKELPKGIIPMNNGTPFYTINQNPVNCGIMNDGDNCEQLWTVNTTGNVGLYYDFFTIYEAVDYPTFIPKNETDKIIITIKQENRAPVLQLINNITVNETDLVSITANAYDADNDALTYYINDSRFNQNNNIFTWQTSYYDSGTYTVNITVSDGKLNDSQDVVVTVINIPIDNDGDGYIDINDGGDDCNDTNPNINPGAAEICNGIDDNCDNIIDNSGDALCDNDLFCDGTETCDGLDGCQAGTPPSVDDGIGCTDDSCDEVNDVIVNTPNNANCDDTLFCNGAETCDALNDCQAGTPIDCDDGVSCTVDSCNEEIDNCDNIATDSLCDNGLWCDGAETCSAVNYPPAGTEQIDTSSYDAFGLLIKNDSDTIIYFFREGSSHVGDKGKIVKQAYTISTATWGARSDVYDDASSELDSRNVGGGIIGNNIFIFFPRYNVTSSTFKDMGYIKSDDLGGSSWSSYTPIDVSPLTLFSPYSHIVKTSDSNTYLQPFYGGNAATEVAQFFKTTDNGNTWSVGPEIYKGTEKYYEVSVAYIGNSKLIALIRDDRWGGGYIKQATSSDDGTTWSGVSDTNLGASYKKKIPYIIYDQETDKVIAIYHDRSYPYQTKISETNALLVYSNPNAWNTPQVIDSGFIMNGYPSIVKTSSNNYFFVYAKEISSSDTDTWGGSYPAQTTFECQAGTPPVINDSVSCTDDSCDETTDTIINTVNDTKCDDTLFCNGAETCDATLDCQAGTPPSVDDGISCTDDSCDEATDTIINAVNDTKCDNSLWCDGTETCDALLDCQAGTPIDCSGNNLAEIATCTNNPDANPFTWDYFAGFTSTCDEQNDVCITGTVSLTHGCSVDSCSAECDSNDDCIETECDNLDGCYTGTYMDYDDVANDCLGDCICESNSCTIYTEIITDTDGDGYDIECDNDCDDTNSNINPGATEICNDNIDNDCDNNIDLNDIDCGECYLSSDCGTDGYVSNSYCINDDVYQPYRTYTCNNPGTSSASCSYTDADTFKETCTNFCYEGECASNTIIPFTFKDVINMSRDNSKLLTGFISAMYHNNKTPINYGRVAILTYSNPNSVDYSYYNPGNAQPAIRKKADPNERGFLEIGVYDITDEQTITITTDNGVINVYIPAVTTKYGGARYYVANDGSTYHTSSTHTYPNGYTGAYDLSLTDALKPEHLAGSKPEYSERCSPKNLAKCNPENLK